MSYRRIEKLDLVKKSCGIDFISSRSERVIVETPHKGFVYAVL